MRDLFLAAARGERTSRPPVWMMRQAGRYLPEYREIRSQYSFLEALSTPEIALEISLQPWERFRPDGVVMYSDILTALEVLGVPYHLEAGIGPVIDHPVSGPDDLEEPHRPIEEELHYVGELLTQLDARLGDEAAVIGFVGGPFTLAAYAVEGEPSRTFMNLRRLRTRRPPDFRELLDRIGTVLADFAAYQVEHGADVIQLFDTYAGLLSPADYAEFLLPIQQRIIDAVDVPTIVFVRNMSGRLDQLEAIGADVVSLDWTVDMATARAELGHTPVQGNLDPAVLFGPQETIRQQTRAIIDAAGESGHILNLGHGVDKATPVEGVRAFFETAQAIER